MAKYLIAAKVEILTEPPSYSYVCKELIEANSPDEAVEIFNEKVNYSSNFPGFFLGEFDETTRKVSIDIDKLL